MQCPQCRTTYTDETLRYCLADGSLLQATPSGDEPTVYRPRANQVTVPISSPQPTQPTVVPRPSRSSSGRWIKIIVGLLILGILGLAVLAVAGVLVYYNSGRNENTVVTKSPTPTATASPTPDSEKRKLEDELANLQKQIEQQKKSVTNTNPFSTDSNNDTGLYKTATVNSPNDGFLALRSLPDADYGQRIAKIPQGETVNVISCADDSVSIGGRTGHWCLITWKSQAGFAFDAFLDY